MLYQLSHISEAEIIFFDNTEQGPKCFSPVKPHMTFLLFTTMVFFYKIIIIASPQTPQREKTNAPLNQITTLLELPTKSHVMKN